MRTIETNGYKINIYDSIEELPAALHSQFNIALLENDGIGYGLDALRDHNQKILDFLTFKNYDSALAQAKNQKFCFDLTEHGTAPIRQAFCHLIHSIDDIQPITRNTEYLLELTSGIPSDLINEIVQEVKKKLQQS